MSPRLPALLTGLVAITVASACSGSSDDAADTTSAPTSEVAIAGPVPSSPGSALDAASTSTSTTSTSTSTTSTTPTPTTPTPTTTTPPRPATLRASAIESRSASRSVSDVSTVVTLPGDDPVALVVGSSMVEGATRHAFAHRTTRGSNLVELGLDHGDASASAAYAAAGDGDRVLVTGSVVLDGVGRTAIWRSDDRGRTFGAYELVGDGPGLGAGATFAQGRPLVISWQPTDGGHELVASRLEGESWVTTAIPTTGRTPTVSGVIAIGDVVVVTGDREVDGRSVGSVWRSTDAGSSFAEVLDPQLAPTTDVGPPANGVDGIVATAAGVGPDPTRLVTSTDGAAWRTIPLDVDLDGTPQALADAGAGTVVAHGERLLVGVDLLLGGVAEVDQNGSGWAIYPPPALDDAVYFDEIPFRLGDGVHVLGRSATGFAMTAQLDGQSWMTERRHGTNSSPEATWLELYSRSDGPVAAASTYPHVAHVEGRFSWSPEVEWARASGDTWSATDDDVFTSKTTNVVSDGTTDVLVSTGDDPADDDISGPTGGGWITVRTGGTWAAPELVVSGPGGDRIGDVALTPSGMVAVGTHDVADAAGTWTSTIAIREYFDGAWHDGPTDVDLGINAGLDEITQAGDGTLFATGELLEGEVERGFVLRREPDAWRRVPLPTESRQVDIFELVPTSAGVEVITSEGDAWFRYRFVDGAFQQAPLVFPDPSADFLRRVVVAGDRTFAVGTHTAMGVSTVVVWELAGDDAVPVEIADAPQGYDVVVTDALVVDGRVLIAGLHDAGHVVWELDLGDQ